MKKLLFPEIKNFNELFSSYTVYGTLKETQEKTIIVNNISNGCMFNRLNNDSKFVHLTANLYPDLLKTINDHLVVNDSLYLKFVQRSDLSTLVCLQYDQIIGNVWLAIIPQEGMPQELAPIPYENLSTNGYITEIHHMQHGHTLDSLFDLMRDYKTTVLTPECFNLDSDDFCHIHGDFELFSCYFKIKTNDPSIIERLKSAYFAEPKLKTIDQGRLFPNGG